MSIPQFKDTLGNLYTIPGAVPYVAPPPPPVQPDWAVIPATAKVVSMLTPLHPWQMNFDKGTQNAAGTASATGITQYPMNAPDGTPNCRLFRFSATGHGGFIYHTHALDDVRGFNTVCYRTREFMPKVGNIAQFERDGELVDPDGTVHDMATQVSNGVIEVTGNRKWQSTGIRVPARKDGVWVDTARFVKYNGDGTVTYFGYEQDGVYYPINETFPQVGATKWGANIFNVQFQNNSIVDNVVSDLYVSLFDMSFWKS